MTIGESARSGPWDGPKTIAGHAVLEIALLFALFYRLAPLFKNENFFISMAIVGGLITRTLGFENARRCLSGGP